MLSKPDSPSIFVDETQDTNFTADISTVFDFQARRGSSKRLVVKRIMRSQFGHLICSCSLPDTIGLHQCLRIDYNLSSAGHHHHIATTDNQW